MKVTDKNFLEEFAEECKTSRIGRTELMMYHIGCEVVRLLGGEFESDREKKLPIPDIGEMGEV